MNYYNENNKYAAHWLRNLIAADIIPKGDVDERSIKDVIGNDLKGYDQCHFFAGIGGWSYALDLAGWPSDVNVWTGSCPCQPFSCAGSGRGEEDERHLWPEFKRLIAKCSPSIVFGEQVAKISGRKWLSGVFTDLEKLGYACAGADLSAATVASPHERSRLFWVAELGDSPRSGNKLRTRKLASDTERKNRGSGPGSTIPCDFILFSPISGCSKAIPDSGGIRCKRVSSIDGNVTKKNESRRVFCTQRQNEIHDSKSIPDAKSERRKRGTANSTGKNGRAGTENGCPESVCNTDCNECGGWGILLQSGEPRKEIVDTFRTGENEFESMGNSASPGFEAKRDKKIISGSDDYSTSQINNSVCDTDIKELEGRGCGSVENPGQRTPWATNEIAYFDERELGNGIIARRLEPGLELLVDGFSFKLADGRARENVKGVRSEMLKGIGNAIIPQVAAVFIMAATTGHGKDKT